MSRDWEVRVERVPEQTRVSVVTIARESRRNALCVDFCRELETRLRTEATREDAGVVVLAGAPPAFCAGADFGDFEAGPDRGGFVEAFNTLLDTLARVPVPVLALVEGPALGAGCQIAAQCDLGVASATATFGITAARIGLQIDMVNVNRLVCEVGPGAARRLLLTGDVVDADEAHRLGLVDRVVPPGDARSSALEWAVEIANRAPLSIRGHKAAIRGVVDGWWLPEDSGAYRSGVESALRAFLSDDLREGLAAFSERRPPDFRGL